MQHLVVVACVAFDIGEHRGFTKIKASFVLRWLTSVPELPDKAWKKPILKKPTTVDPVGLISEFSVTTLDFVQCLKMPNYWRLLSLPSHHNNEYQHFKLFSFTLENTFTHLSSNAKSYFLLKYTCGLLSSLRDINVCYELHSTDKNYKAHVKRAPLITRLCTFDLKPFEFVSVRCSNEMYRPEGMYSSSTDGRSHQIYFDGDLSKKPRNLVWLIYMFSFFFV